MLIYCDNLALLKEGGGEDTQVKQLSRGSSFTLNAFRLSKLRMMHLHHILKLLISCAIGTTLIRNTDDVMVILEDFWARRALLIDQAVVIFFSNRLKSNVIVSGGNSCCLLRRSN